ncbi:MFS transporter [Kutzneria kofuensis]|uniref:EmrB/QacA subfamily drug resistance transporter n=1 Tax=Kutzneria kofuensis TaxID=103725 RepID=A0A7W9NJL1_9PSEU|nr:MFS transporter [Kutzneria kofuensis]MBB5894789.1 EmrB/QacA subfamily drug resistance transporter [Kutzneria kofuensis]
MNDRPGNPWGALAALCIGFFMILLDATIVSIAIPAMLRGLNASLNAVVWVTSVYLLTYAVPMLFTSRLGDRFGPKRVFMVGLVLFTLASLWCGLAGDVGTLIAARGVQGIGAALMTPQTLAFISFLFPPARRGAAMGVWGGVAGLATVAGPLLGGVLVDNFNWPWIFYVNVPIGVVAVVMTVALVPDWRPNTGHSFDVPGILLSGAGLLLLVFGLQNGQQYDWGEVWGGITVFEIIAAGVVLLIAFAVWQRFNRREPLLPLRVFGNRNFSSGVLASVTVGFTMTGMFFPIVIYLQTVLGLTPLHAGLLTAPMSLLSGAVAPFVGRLSDKVNAKFLLMFGLVALAGGLAWISLQVTPTTAPLALIPALLVCGLGIGFIFSPMSAVTMGSVPRELTGAASGIFNTARQVGGVLGSAAVGVLLQARITASLADSTAGLPPQIRTGLSDAANVEGGAPPDLGSVPDGVRQQVTDAIHSGLTTAASQTLWLPAGFLVLGALAALAMRTSRRPAPAPNPGESRSAAPRM